MATEKRYYWTYDNPRNGNYGRARRLLGAVAHVETIAPKTTFELVRRKNISFDDFRKAIKATLDPRKGCGMLFSSSTGNVFEINNRGNQPGRLIRR